MSCICIKKNLLLDMTRGENNIAPLVIWGLDTFIISDVQPNLDNDISFQMCSLVIFYLFRDRPELIIIRSNRLENRDINKQMQTIP